MKYLVIFHLCFLAFVPSRRGFLLVSKLKNETEGLSISNNRNLIEESRHKRHLMILGDSLTLQLCDEKKHIIRSLEKQYTGYDVDLLIIGENGATVHRLLELWKGKLN